MELPQTYDPSKVFQSTNGLYNNHFKFTLERLPDLSFFVQEVELPGVSSVPVPQVNPFSTIYHPSDRLSFSQFRVTYLIDAQFKNYFSLFYWMCGYGFPQSWDEVVAFRAKQTTLVANPRPKPIELEKTYAVLSICTPDTSVVIAEIRLEDVFPIDLSAVPFSTDGENTMLRTTCTFSTSRFSVKLT